MMKRNGEETRIKTGNMKQQVSAEGPTSTQNPGFTSHSASH